MATSSQIIFDVRLGVAGLYWLVRGFETAPSDGRRVVRVRVGVALVVASMVGFAIHGLMP